MAAAEVIKNDGTVGSIGVGVYCCNWYVCSAKGSNLVVHQGQERGDDNSDTMVDDSW